ncbi:alkaline phosphatase family protein [Tautonia plasticadhaerens]|uniref:Type I phosphodiesterase / nucleotide pyrophosphatase n=1 Tax=Tautonia plasticadhaerens TaxID=2527974 RepID=A0A518H7D1_9BACT|nr:alkaline phosphatase family protein [Tautonia plasticadhaerens]QDV36779.1 Type I phosphodiesterase / nucleotide pyrophosphatase [Tautonia plasticadhaerens]
MGELGIDKVIVVGLDGLEPSLVDRMLEEGLLPNLAALRERGGYGRVGTTFPAQTPVAWSTFATGTNPGSHGIFDFLNRDPASYRLELALNRYDRSGPLQSPRLVNLRRGVPFWQLLSDRGIPSSVIRCPCTYPPDEIEGRVLSGMGVPDLRGGFGTGTYYSTESGLSPGEAELLVPLPSAWPGTIETVLLGPRNPRTRSEIRVPISLEPIEGTARVLLHSPGSPGTIELMQGRWSDWLRVPFKFGLLQSVIGLVRFYLREAGPHRLELYASPLQFDPKAPAFPISHPRSYSADLAREIGPFHTTGLSEDHAALSNGRIDESAFLSQCDDLWREREAMFERELDRLDSGLLFCLFGIPDRVQHLFWRHLEPDHPANRLRPPDREHRGAISEAYRRSDAAVGRAIRAADDRTLVIALSDHGFTSFRRGINLNTWLNERGLFHLHPGSRADETDGPPLGAIDWTRTRAYAVGLAGIYLNLEGREGQGIVTPEEAGPLRSEIASALTGLVDPADGTIAVRSVVPSEHVYSGPYVDEAADLLVHVEKGYRSSWGSAMGRMGDSVFEDNTRIWSGDHIVDPALVPGVLFLNRPFRSEGASMIDLAPTVLDALGLPAGPRMEGRSLLR